jgi:transposase
MPKKFPQEFKRDVVTVARRGDLTVAEVAADFGIAPESVRRWMRQADIDDGIKDGLTSAEQSELVSLRREKRRPTKDLVLHLEASLLTPEPDVLLLFARRQTIFQAVIDVGLV